MSWELEITPEVRADIDKARYVLQRDETRLLTDLQQRVSELSDTVDMILLLLSSHVGAGHSSSRTGYLMEHQRIREEASR